MVILNLILKKENIGALHKVAQRHSIFHKKMKCMVFHKIAQTITEKM